MDQVQSFYQDTIGWLVNIVVVTDARATYGNASVQQLWLIALYISDGLGALFFVAAGYQLIFSSFSGQYVQVLDLLPRVVFSLIAAHLSLYFAELTIELDNNLCLVFISQRNIGTLFAHTTGASLFVLPFLVVFAVLMFLFCLIMVGRVALLDFLIVILPWLCLLLAHRSTERVGRAGLEAYLSTVYIQVAENILLTLGLNVAIPFFTASLGGARSELSPIANLVLGIALFLLMLQLPAILGRIIIQPMGHAGGVLRTLVVTAIARIL